MYLPLENIRLLSEEEVKNQGRHPALDDLLELAAGHFEAATREHVGRCASCQGQIEEIQSIGAALQACDFAEPSEACVLRAIRIPEQQPRPVAAGLTEKIAQLVRVLAVPAFAPALAGVRSTASPSRRMLFGSEDIEVEVEVAKRAVAGQAVLTDGASPVGLVGIEQAGDRVAERPIGEFGTFRFDGGYEPPFDIVLDLVDERIRVPIRSEPSP